MLNFNFAAVGSESDFLGLVIPLRTAQVDVTIGLEAHVFSSEQCPLSGPVRGSSTHTVHHPVARNGLIGHAV